MKIHKKSPRIKRFALFGIAIFILGGLFLGAYSSVSTWILGVTSQRYIDVIFPTVKTTKNIAYGPQTVHRLDVYEPIGDTENKKAAIVWIHGGGFTSGSKEQFSTIGPDYAKRGFVSFSINYTLVNQEVTMTSPNAYSAISKAKNDANTAIRWIKAHAEEYGIDPAKIIAAGFSAGAVTSLYVAYDTPTPEVAAAVSFSGGMLNTTTIGSSDPPAILIHGQQDAIVPLALAKSVSDRLQTLGIAHELDTYPTGHNTTVLEDAHMKVRAFLTSTLNLTGENTTQTPSPTGTPHATSGTEHDGSNQSGAARTQREQRMLRLLHQYFPRVNDQEALAAFRRGGADGLWQFLLSQRRRSR